MSRELVLSKAIQRGNHEVLPPSMKRKQMTKRKAEAAHIEILVGKAGLLCYPFIALGFTTATLVGWDTGASILPGLVAILLSIFAVPVSIATAFMPAARTRSNYINPIIPENQGFFNLRGELEGYNGKYCTRWTTVKKPSLWSVFNPARLFSNVVLSKYVEHDLASDIYTVHTFYGSVLRVTHKQETFAGDRAVFREIANNMKEIAK